MHACDITRAASRRVRGRIPEHASERACLSRSRRHAFCLVNRQNYVARVGGSRFLQVDPIEGGSSNDYDYVYGDPVNNFDLDGRFCVTGKNKNGSCRSITRGTRNWMKHRWNRDTTSIAYCKILACLTGYTYRNAQGQRRWKLGVQVGLMFPGVSVTSASGTPNPYPSGNWSVGAPVHGVGVCGGRSSFAKGWNFTLGAGHCAGIWAGP